MKIASIEAYPHNFFSDGNEGRENRENFYRDRIIKIDIIEPKR